MLNVKPFTQLEAVLAPFKRPGVSHKSATLFSRGVQTEKPEDLSALYLLSAEGYKHAIEAIREKPEGQLFCSHQRC